MIDIIGGVYDERCQFPIWRQTFGSGGRAAAVIACLGSQARLHTFCSPEAKAQCLALADTFGFELASTSNAPRIAFDYFHALTPVQASPSLYPLYDPGRVLRVDAELALRFGTLEGEALVHGRRVVYDPQSPNAPVPYGQNGSTASELAIVCNSTEARALSGQTDIQSCAAALLSQAQVVVIKSGISGALVATQQGQTRVPAYLTDSVFPIGSGDVFSAAFAKAWLLDGQRPDDAADRASRATAMYCGSRVFPSQQRFEEEASKLTAFVRIRSAEQVPRVYLAGPFFTMHQMWLVEVARDELTRAGLSVFSPYHDVGVDGGSNEIARRDLQGLDGCDLVFALMDTIDAGTLFEVGYAHKAGKPVVVFAGHVQSGDLTMIEGTGALVVSDFATAIYKAAWTGWSIT